MIYLFLTSCGSGSIIPPCKTDSVCVLSGIDANRKVFWGTCTSQTDLADLRLRFCRGMHWAFKNTDQR